MDARAVLDQLTVLISQGQDRADGVRRLSARRLVVAVVLTASVRDGRRTPGAGGSCRIPMPRLVPDAREAGHLPRGAIRLTRRSPSPRDC